MARFQYREKTHSGLKMILAICISVAVIVIFFCCVNILSSTADDRQRESLENALTNSIAHCYATEGVYPDSLDYIKKNYGLTYDENRFYIDYRPMGANILPDVTILELDDKDNTR